MNDLSLQTWLARLAEFSPTVLMLWKVSILFAAAWLAHALLGRANPRWRVLVWRGTAVGLLLLPILSWVTPAIELVSAKPVVEMIGAPTASEDDAGHEDDQGASVSPSAQAEALVMSPVLNSIDKANTWTRFVPTWQFTLLAIWSGGFIFFAFRTAVGLYRIHSLIQEANPASTEVVSVFERVVRKLEIHREVELRVSSDIRSPILCGHLWPKLLIPQRMDDKSRASQLPGVFAHELAHVRSRDLSWNLVLHAISSALWFHPLVWFSRAAHEAACESVSDAVAARYVGDVKVYSQTLAQVALDALSPPMLSLGMSRTSDVRRRVGALERKVFARDLGRRMVATALACGLVFAAGLGGLRVVRAEVTLEQLRVAADQAKVRGERTTAASGQDADTNKDRAQKDAHKDAHKGSKKDSKNGAQNDDSKRANSLIAKETSTAADKALRYLVAKQKADGSFGGQQKSNELAVTALCGQAFLSAGSKPGNGQYGTEIQKSVDFVLKHVTDSGLIAGTSGSMYVHAYTLRFLADAHLASPTPETKNALVKGVELIVKSQNARDGWRYSPASQDADSSVTACILAALQTSRRAGIEVPDDTIIRAVNYLTSCSNQDGGFSYTAFRPGPNQSGIARSAAAMSALLLSDVADKKLRSAGIAYLHGNSNVAIGKDPYFYYTQYHLSTALRYAGPKHFQRWYKVAQEDLVKLQARDGSWTDAGFGNEYATASACIVLLSPNQPVIRMAQE